MLSVSTLSPSLTPNPRSPMGPAVTCAVALPILLANQVFIEVRITFVYLLMQHRAWCVMGA